MHPPELGPIEISALAGTLAGAAWLLRGAVTRLQLSLAKHPSLGGHAKLAQWIGSKVPGVHYDEHFFFSSDGAQPDIVATRRRSFSELARQLGGRNIRSIKATQRLHEHLPDLQFTQFYRVPHPYSTLVSRHLPTSAFWSQSQGVQIENLDGARSYDLTGSYGVNVFGLDFYKSCIDEGVALARQLGPVLGGHHPCILRNVESLRAVSRLDDVSFHMSGTEAVMQAVRLARYHTGRSHVVRFCGAYHGWWDDVQPGPGNPLPARETYTLRDMHPRSLGVLRHRKDIACVLVNPLQALHPNSAAPSDSMAVDSSRTASFDRESYRKWLADLRQVCSERGIALILDEVFLGFRLAAGGAQEYFGVQADMVTYGKTVAGGLPIGVVCGKTAWMRRFRTDRPGDICFARGTFNAHPYVMATMAAFFERWFNPDTQNLYRGLDQLWDDRAHELNQRLESAALPVRVANLGTVWTILYLQPSRYNWMFQFYLRTQGLALSWIGSGRLIFSLNFREHDFAQVAERFLHAAHNMQEGGWWSPVPGLSNGSIRRQLVLEMIKNRFFHHPVSSHRSVQEESL